MKMKLTVILVPAQLFHMSINNSSIHQIFAHPSRCMSQERKALSRRTYAIYQNYYFTSWCFFQLSLDLCWSSIFITRSRAAFFVMPAIFTVVCFVIEGPLLHNTTIFFNSWLWYCRKSSYTSTFTSLSPQMIGHVFIPLGYKSTHYVQLQRIWAQSGSDCIPVTFC